MAFQVTVDQKVLTIARGWIKNGWVTAVAVDTEGAYWIEIDASRTARSAVPAVVIKASVEDGRICITGNPPMLKRTMTTATELGVAVEILRLAGAVKIPGNVARVELTKEDPEVPSRGLTDQAPTLLKKVSDGVFVKPEFPDPAAEYIEEMVEEPEETLEDDFAGVDDFTFDPAADEVRAYLLEEGIPLELANKVIAARRNDLTPELQARVPALKRFRGNKEVLATALASMLLGKNIFAVGPKSGGKTTLIHTLAACFNLPLYELNGSLQTEVSDIRGDKTLDVDAETKASVVQYQLGVLAEAMVNGGLCHIDEFPTIREGVATIINGVGDWRKSLEIPGYGVIHAHPAFRLALGGNKGYAGCLVPNEATTDRMVVLDVQPVKDQAAIERIIAENSKHCRDRLLISKLARLFTKLQQMLEAGEINTAECLSIRGLIDAADLMSLTTGVVSHRAVLYSTVVNKIWDDQFADAAKVREQVNLVFPD